MENDLVPCYIYEEKRIITYALIKNISPQHIENKSNIVVSLPFWLALKLQKFNLLWIEVPAIFSSTILNVLDGDPVNTNLFSIHENYFEKAIYVKRKNYFLGDNEAIIENARVERFHAILEKAHFHTDINTKDFFCMLTNDEREEFNLRKLSEENYMKWKRCSNFKDFFKLMRNN